MKEPVDAATLEAHEPGTFSAFFLFLSFFLSSFSQLCMVSRYAKVIKQERKSFDIADMMLLIKYSYTREEIHQKANSREKQTSKQPSLSCAHVLRSRRLARNKG